MLARDAEQAISGAIRHGNKNTTSDGTEYHTPPQCGGTIYQGLPLWKLVSEKLGMPVAKDYQDGSFYVVTPSTTETELRAMYQSNTGTAGFEAQVKKASQEFS